MYGAILGDISGEPFEFDRGNKYPHAGYGARFIRRLSEEGAELRKTDLHLWRLRSKKN